MSLIKFFTSLFSKTLTTTTGKVDVDIIEYDTQNNIEESSDTDSEFVDKVITEQDVWDIIDDSCVEENEVISETIQETDSDVAVGKNCNKCDKVVVFLLAGHVDKTPGKKSPDKSLYEWKYNREIVSMIEKEFDNLGIEYWNAHPEDSWVDETHNNDSKDLVLRALRINKKYSEVKSKNKKAFLLEVHVNAAGSGDWYNATGWSAYTTKGLNNSDKLADCLYDAAEEVLLPLGKKLRTDKSDGDRDNESNFYVIRTVNCVCTLTENFFMDNKDDVKFLLSDAGKKAIVDVHVNGALKYIEKYC